MSKFYYKSPCAVSAATPVPVPVSAFLRPGRVCLAYASALICIKTLTNIFHFIMAGGVPKKNDNKAQAKQQSTRDSGEIQYVLSSVFVFYSFAQTNDKRDADEERSQKMQIWIESTLQITIFLEIPTMGNCSSITWIQELWRSLSFNILKFLKSLYFKMDLRTNCYRKLAGPEDVQGYSYIKNCSCL